MSVLYIVQSARKCDGQWSEWNAWDEETDVKEAERRLENHREFYTHHGEMKWRLVKRVRTDEVLFERHMNDEKVEVEL